MPTTPTHALQEFGLSQMRTINHFFDFKMEVLFALLKPEDVRAIVPMQQAFLAVQEVLMKLKRQLESSPLEQLATQQLRLRGVNALRRMAQDAALKTREAASELPTHLTQARYTPDEWHVLLETADSLVVIMESNLYLLSESDPHEKVY